MLYSLSSRKKIINNNNSNNNDNNDDDDDADNDDDSDDDDDYDHLSLNSSHKASVMINYKASETVYVINVKQKSS